MMHRYLSQLMAALLLFQGCVSAEDPLEEEAGRTLKKATAYFHAISTRGGYAGIYSVDLKQRYGESFNEQAGATEIWVQPPGTPSVGECFLRAYRITGDQQFLSAATDAARALAWGQRTQGGWDHRADVAHLDMGSKTAIRKEGHCTFDDNITQGALCFLMSMDAVIDEPWLSGAIELGLYFLMKSQFENGAWPQDAEAISSSFPSYPHPSPAGPSSTVTISSRHGPGVLSRPVSAVRPPSGISGPC